MKLILRFARDLFRLNVLLLIKTDDVYDGNYDVIPRVYQQVLPTKDKLMLDDVTVEIIPLSKIINLQNGYTVTIG